jgi:hypothetical protein
LCGLWSVVTILRRVWIAVLFSRGENMRRVFLLVTILLGFIARVSLADTLTMKDGTKVVFEGKFKKK